MKKPLCVRTSIAQAFRIITSHPIFFVFGVIMTLPTLFPTPGIEEKHILALFQTEEWPFTPSQSLLFLTLAGITLLTRSFGTFALITLTHRQEKNDPLSFSCLKPTMVPRTRSILLMTLLLTLGAIFLSVILSIPPLIAHSRGLENLTHALSLSAIGLAISICLLLFFLHQYAALYLSLSKISLRSALENAVHLFRLHIRETFLISAVFFTASIVIFLLLDALSMIIPNSSTSETIFLWGMSLVLFSFLEAWNWSSWTVFFRMIALPKDPEPVLQKEESVLQQESAVSLDKA